MHERRKQGTDDCKLDRGHNTTRNNKKYDEGGYITHHLMIGYARVGEREERKKDRKEKRPRKRSSRLYQM